MSVTLPGDLPHPVVRELSRKLVEAGRDHAKTRGYGPILSSVSLPGLTDPPRPTIPDGPFLAEITFDAGDIQTVAAIPSPDGQSLNYVTAAGDRGTIGPGSLHWVRVVE